MNSAQRHLEIETLQQLTRRHFLRQCATGLGAMWLGGLGLNSALATPRRDLTKPLGVLPPHFAPKAKRVIYLHMAGAPSQLELFQYKPELAKLDGQDCPQSFLEGQRFAFITGVPKLMGPVYPFHRETKTGLWVSDRLPHLEKHFDKITFINSMVTDQFNHAPAQLLCHTGNQNLGYASFGSWVTYGLGTENENLPGYIALLSGGNQPDGGKSLWGSGFLPSVYQGVQCRSKGEPVLFLDNPPGIDRELRGDVVKTIAALNQRTYQQLGDPETVTRISQYELAFRMQTSAADAFDLRQESPETHALYGTEPGKESFANNCLLARRLAERGVRFIQLFDWGWDSHGTDKATAINDGFANKCRQIDQPVAALLTDLERRGMLQDTLVIWGGEFGRTPMRENRNGVEMKFLGRDHHPSSFTIMLAGGGVKGGFSFGETDPIGYHVVGEPVQVRDLHATLLHLLGLEHRQLTYNFQGLEQKLTGVKQSKVIEQILA